MILTDKEKKIIERIERREKFITGIYVSIGVSFVFAISLFMLGYYFKEKTMFIGSLYFATLGIFLLVSISTQRKLYFIIKKYQQEKKV